MNHIYQTAEAALSADVLGSKTLATLEAVLELTGKPAKDVVDDISLDHHN